MSKNSESQKVALFTPFMTHGGAQKMMAQLAGEFAMGGLSVDMVLMRADGEYLGLIPPQVRIVDLNKSRMIASLFALVCYLKKERPSVLMTSPVVASVVALLASRISRVPTKVIVREAVCLSSEIENARIFSTFWFCLKLMPLVYKWADGFIAISNGVADDLSSIAKIPRDKINVIYNPVLTDRFQNQIDKPADHEWFQPGASPVVLGVGRFTSQKDFVTLIRAFSIVRKQMKAHLVIFGDGPERQRLERTIDEYGLNCDVALPGFTDNPMAYMAKSAVFVMSSVYEGFGNVIVEAMACGTPVVSTNCPSGPSEILANGKYGKLVAVGDSKEMADAILEILVSKPDTGASKNRALNFRSDVIAEQYKLVLLSHQNQGVGCQQ